MARTLVKAEAADRQTWTGTTDYQNAVGVVAWQPAADTDYLVIWHCLLDGSVAGSSVRAQLYNETTATSMDEQAISPDAVSGPADLGTAGGFKRLQFTTAPSAQTIRIRFKTHNSAATVGISEAKIFVLQMTANDEYTEALGTVSTTSTTYQVAATLTWTPDGSKDYLIMHDSKIRNSASGADDAALRFRKGSTTIVEASPIAQRDNSAGRAALTCFVKQTLSGAQSWTSEYKCVASGTSNVGSVALCALFLDDFESDTYAEQAAEVTTASTSAQTAASISPTLTANDYLILACALSRNSSANTPTLVSLTQDDVALITESAREEETGDQHYYSFWAAYHDTFAAGSSTFAVKYRNHASDGTARLGSVAIAALQITAASAVLPAPDITATVYLRNRAAIDDIDDLDTGGSAATDPDVVEIVDAPMHGTATVAGLLINYLPDNGFTGTDTFTYRYTTSTGAQSATATATITVLPFKLASRRKAFVTPQGIGTGASGAPATQDNLSVSTPMTGDAPVAANDTVTTDFNTELELNVLGNDTAGAAAIDPSSVEVLSSPAHGTAVHAGNGTITYTPAAGFSGKDSFSYQVYDVEGRVSNAATVTVNVLEAPIPVSFTNGYGYRTRFRIPAARHGGVASMLFTYDETKANFKSVANAGLVENDTFLDVRVENANGDVLSYRKVFYDPATGRLRLLIKIAPTSGVDYGGFVYIGKAGLVATEEDVAGLYSGAVDVWNLETGASLISSGRTLTLTGTAGGSAFDDGLTTDGSASYASTALSLTGFYNLTALTVEIFAKPAAGSVGTDHGLLVLGPSGNANDRDATFFIRLDAAGFYGEATNCVTAGCRTSTDSVRIESRGSLHDTSAHHYAFVWSTGTKPKLVVDGIEAGATWVGKITASGTETATEDALVSGNTVAPTSGDLRFGVGPKGSATGSFIGELAEARVWNTAKSAARLAAEQISFLYPSRFYGSGQIEAPNVNQGPVAMPVWTNINKNAANIDIDVKTSGGFDADGDTLSLTAVGTPGNGAASVVSGKARYNVNDTFVGTDTFTYTLSDGTDTGVGTAVVVVTDPGSGTGAGAYEYVHAFPWLPAGTGEENIDVWNVPAAGGGNTAAGSATKILLVVLPDDFSPTGQVGVSGAGGNGTLYRGVVIVGGSYRRRSTVYGIPPSGTTDDFPNGLPGGHMFQFKFGNVGVRPFVWISNLFCDNLDADGNRTCYWGDFIRIWHASENDANAPELYLQKTKLENGNWGYTAQAPLVTIDSEAPHTDLIQAPGGKCHNLYLAEVDLETGYQGLFLSQQVNWTPTAQCRLDKVSLRSLPVKNTAPVITRDQRKLIKVGTDADINAGRFVEVISSQVARDANPTTYTPTVWLETLETPPPGDTIEPSSLWAYNDGVITSGTKKVNNRYPLSDGSEGVAKFNVGLPGTPVVDTTHIGDDAKVITGTDLRAKMT